MYYVCLNRINVISGDSSPYEVIKHVRNRLEMIYKNREQTRLLTVPGLR